MATASPNITLGGLPRRLVVDGLLDEETASKAYQEAQKKKKPFVTHLVENKILDAAKIARVAAAEFGAPQVDITILSLEDAPVGLVEEKLIRQHHALPIFKRGKRLYVAVSDPTNLQALDEIKFHTGLTTDLVLVEDDKLTDAIEKAMSAQDTSMEDLDEDLDNIDFADDAGEGGEDEGVTGGDVDEAPVVRFVNKVLLDAINKGASDLHFEPYEKRYRVRFRIDGVLSEIASPPLALSPRIAARLKVMSRLNTAERRVPQDGRIKLKLSKTRSIDFRVNTCPTLFGEKIVMRILDPSSAKMGIDALGYDPEQKQLYLDNLEKPYGMILVTGPTGSGKTVSLYTGVNILNTVDRNISTAEDPVEINLEGVNQVNINEKVGMTFEAALKAFLRQDPDIILVGEIRDLGTGAIAIKAAQTGHMVMSTLHTNDAPQTLTRMINMGIPPFNIASAVNLIIAQRLGRRLCKSCKRVIDIPKDSLVEEGFTEEDIEGGIKVYAHNPDGCDSCAAGYKGRVGIYQVMPISEAMGRLIMENANAYTLADQAKEEGIPDLRRSALAKVMQGLTSLEEANRVTLD
ncbi:MAG: type IV-A pilus assembly ATPase PilB [Gammaproteobacteria bacterium]|nr:MAG: type IV-A pilus assembly ATPase PilB [Gammaproteobacteria bacterium]